MITWKLEKRKISDLTPHPKNPRKLSKHDAEHLEMSLERFGLVEKPIITPQGQIIGGHQRLSILKKMKAKEIDCWVPDRDLSEKEVEELNIRLNRSQGEFDYDLLANMYEQEDLIEYGFKVTDLGMDMPMLDDVPSSEEEAKKKKCKTCPSCGHEF